MKKRIIALLLLAALLTGCGGPQPMRPAGSTVPPGTEASEPVETTEMTETTVATAATEATEAVEITESVELPETTQTEPAGSTTATKPASPEEAPEVTVPVQPEQTQPPETTVPPPSQSSPPAPSVSGRPTSSATCRDTGSDEIWVDPASAGADYYEETDPERTEFLEYLKAEGNEFYFWIIEEDMRMYLGRTYGIPIYSSWEIVMESVWVSSDPSVATVNQVGFVKPLKAGTTVITVSITDPQTQEVCTRKCNVTVKGEPVYTYAQLEQRAKEEARLIADYVMGNPAYQTDLERIAVAAYLINQYVAEGVSTSNVPGYNQPYGTLVTFYSSCAGSTRAMGLVLEYMGFQWYHVNENQWDHQWCVVYDVDGQTAFADGSVYGIAGYGERREDGSNWMQYRNGALVPF